MPTIPSYIDLGDFIRVNTDCEIFCDFCSEYESFNGDDERGAKLFFDKGWRADGDSVACPRCTHMVQE